MCVCVCVCARAREREREREEMSNEYFFQGLLLFLCGKVMPAPGKYRESILLPACSQQSGQHSCRATDHAACSAVHSLAINSTVSSMSLVFASFC